MEFTANDRMGNPYIDIQLEEDCKYRCTLFPGDMSCYERIVVSVHSKSGFRSILNFNAEKIPEILEMNIITNKQLIEALDSIYHRTEAFFSTERE